MGFKTTKQRFYIVREDIAGDSFVNKRVKVEIDEMDIRTILDLLSGVYEQNCGGKNKLHKALLNDKKLPYYKLMKVL